MRLTLLLCLSYLGAISQDYLDIQIPTAEQETEYIWRNLQDIAFFEKYQYNLSLPRGPLLEDLKDKARSNSLTDEDYQALSRFIKTKVYRKEDYQAGHQKIVQREALLNKMVRRLARHQRAWAFQMYDTYQVVLTLYGPGGSYDPATGQITMFTTQDGRFKTSDDAAEVLIHEIVHIGIEASIVQAMQVPHPLKERIVDRLVVVYFQQWLPNYRVQEMGEDRIDPYLQKRKDAKDLKENLRQIMEVESFKNKN